ncbi:uncharacterized protein LOC119437218 [Dermacentor silvarum]|uniref:uncharacterized protein LOC119437218 n=1 Tax=Dermacentor silvarum TaxID=543639 RepID=UPI002100AAC0|nr:uncharacterized protein LOC119437218 [Dermacentor silvarum]
MDKQQSSLACYNINVRAVSDLQDGLQLLKLLSTVNPSASIDNFNPGKTFSSIKKQLCGHHACLRARFLFLGVANKSKCNVHFAITTILALSVLALQATSCSPTIEVAPLKLRKTAQCCIIDFIEIVSASDDVLDNLAAYLKASYVEHLSSAKVKRRKNESFTTRLSEAPTPNKRNSISPQQQILVAAKSDLEREIAAVKKERDDLTASLSSQQSTKRLKTGPNAVCVSKSSSIHCKRTVTRLLKSSRKSWMWNLIPSRWRSPLGSRMLRQSWRKRKLQLLGSLISIQGSLNAIAFHS